MVLLSSCRHDTVLDSYQKYARQKVVAYGQRGWQKAADTERIHLDMPEMLYNYGNMLKVDEVPTNVPE